jgi:hypothetical protein
VADDLAEPEILEEIAGAGFGHEPVPLKRLHPGASL